MNLGGRVQSVRRRGIGLYVEGKIPTDIAPPLPLTSDGQLLHHARPRTTIAIKMASKQDFKTLNRAAVDAEGAFVDGRLKNIAFKHKQLRALFRERKQTATVRPPG